MCYEKSIFKWIAVGDSNLARRAWRGEVFVIGSTGDVLQGLGAIESDIYLNGDKIKIILKDHPEMTIEEIKKIPEILDNPALVLKSRGSNNRGQNTRLAVLGSAKAQNNEYILVAFDLRPNEKGFIINDMQKVSSAYGKDNLAGLLTKSEILYYTQKKATSILHAVGLQYRPTEWNKSNFLGSITYAGDIVNIKGLPFDEVFVNSESVTDSFDSVIFSIKYDVDNKPYVEIDRDILQWAPIHVWVAIVKSSIINLYRTSIAECTQKTGEERYTAKTQNELGCSCSTPVSNTLPQQNGDVKFSLKTILAWDYRRYRERYF